MKIRSLLFFVMIVASLQMFAQKKGIIQVSFDPTMLVNGPYSDSQKGALDFLIKTSIGDSKNEFGLYFEKFKAMEYTSAGVLYNYKMELAKVSSVLNNMIGLIGLDAGYIRRDLAKTSDAFTVSLNAELRYLVSKNFGVNLTSNYRVRGDLIDLYNDKTPFIFSGYVGLFVIL
ncbi:hypothetical protein QVZ41_07700 [Wenyingzhuangia sp. chi5]|uniref:Conjugative transposon protein TraO n=1 Tax=Wenyingzhuangia gilva TaxID=3057677 RepID=A0ABT8VRX9_9FLAO|nr:hypothetical protein [Wenyingzhuangia sp. chi5]MDO3694724.1 hypothetical protein [Wenyingzhuangia sp. chi5]